MARRIDDLLVEIQRLGIELEEAHKENHALRNVLRVSLSKCHRTFASILEIVDLADDTEMHHEVTKVIADTTRELDIIMQEE